MIFLPFQLLTIVTDSWLHTLAITRDAKLRFGRTCLQKSCLQGSRCNLTRREGPQPQQTGFLASSSIAGEILRERLESNGQAGCSGRPGVSCQAAAGVFQPEPRTSGLFSGRDWQFLLVGALTAFCLNVAAQWATRLPVWRRTVQRFIWWKDGVQPEPAATEAPTGTTALALYSDNAESVEWFNMCWRKMWRVYQRGLERWLADLLQPVFDNLVAEVAVPRFVQRLRILEFTLDHEAPTFSQMRRRSSRKDSDLNGVVNVRYTGGARMLLLIEVGQGRWRFKLPVLVSDLDLECKLWIKLRLAPMPPYIGTIALAFVGPPTIKVQLLPYNHVRLMQIPILQPFLSRLLTVDLPGLMVLPKRLQINIPPAVSAVAEAAVGRDAVMRAVASAVLQADALEHALIAALPLGPQSAAGGVSLPDSFHGELQVNLLEARNLPVWGFSWQSNPYCRLILGEQAMRSRRDDATSHAGRHRAPVWNQEFTFLVEDPMNQVLEVQVRDSPLTGRADLGRVKYPLRNIPPDGHISSWLPVEPWAPGRKAEGQLLVKMTYKPFEDDETDVGYREAEAFALMLQEQAITDIKSAADASSRAAVAASAAAAAVAVTKAAAARAAAKAALNAKARARQKRMQAAEKLEKGLDGRIDRRAGKQDRGMSGQEEGRKQISGLAQNGSDGQGDGIASREVPEAVTSRLDSLGLQDISPEDLFPPVSFTINDRADEDMPYTEPEEPSEGDASRKGSGSAKGAHGKEVRSTGERQDSHRAGKAASHLSHSRKDEAGGQSGLEKEQFDKRKLDNSEAAKFGEDLPLILSTIEGANTDDALRIDSGAFSDVIEAVAKGDIKPLANKKRSGQKERNTSTGSAASVGRGSIADDSEAPSRVDAGVEFTANEGTNAATEAEKARSQSGGGASIGFSQGGEQAAPSHQHGIFKSILGKLPFISQQRQERIHDSPAESVPDKGQNPTEESLDDDTIKDVKLRDGIELEAIAEEVQNSWRLKEVRAEALMQKAVARSERPWLILVASLFSSTVVLLALVLWRLYYMGTGKGPLD